MLRQLRAYRVLVPVLLLGLIGSATLAGDTGPAASQTAPRRVPTRVDELKNGAKEGVDAAAGGILADQKRLVDGLIEIVDPANKAQYAERTRGVAAYLLGELRAEKAAPVLCKALANEPGDFFMANGNHTSPVWTALVRIGRPAVPELIRNVEESDDRAVADDSSIALWHILGGKQHLLELLDKLEKRAQDEKVKARITAQIGRTKEGKDDNPPLY